MKIGTRHYRNYTIEYNPPPIPSRAHDYEFVHAEYDGAPEHSFGSPSDHRHGTAPSIEDAIMQIDEQILDAAEDLL